jgi:hypothetical protein
VIVVHKNTNITEYVSSISWGGSRTEVARKLELKVVNAPLDDNITPLTIDLADPVYLFEDDGKTELFRGFVTEREASSVQGVVTYVAYDLLFYTLKSKATYNFSSKTAETITKMVCNDMEIPIGSLASTELSQKLIVQNVSIYEIIMQAYTQAYQKNGVSYRVTAKKGTLNVEEMGKIVCEIELTEDSNITSSQYKETLTNMVNKVRIYDGEGNPAGVVQNDADVKKYGIFQQVYTKEEGKDPTTTAKSMFVGVEKTFTLNCVNCNGAVTGAGAVVRDSSTGLSGVVWIDADTHTWNNGVATMSLTVTLKQMMDTKENNSSQKKEDDTSTGGGGDSGSTGTYTPTYGSKSNPPFEVVNNYWRTEKSGFNNYSDAFNYYSSNGGSSKGWKILDKNRKEVQI